MCIRDSKNIALENNCVDIDSDNEILARVEVENEGMFECVESERKCRESTFVKLSLIHIWVSMYCPCVDDDGTKDKLHRNFSVLFLLCFLSERVLCQLIRKIFFF